jgi:hypothetical protein
MSLNITHITPIVNMDGQQGHGDTRQHQELVGQQVALPCLHPSHCFSELVVW